MRQRFERELASRVRVDFFTQKPSSLVIPGRQECAYCEDVRTLIEELAALSSRIALTVHDLDAEPALAAELGVDKVPAIVLRGPTNRPVRFFGLPSGTEFPAFVDVLVDVGRVTVALQPATIKALRKIKTDVKLQLLVTTTCPYCPPLVRTAVRFGLQSVRVKVDVVEVVEFPAIVQRYKVRAVPTTVIGDKLALPGVMDEATLLQDLQRVVEGRPMTSDMKPGASTSLDPAAFQQKAQAQPRTTAGGLILLR